MNREIIEGDVSQVFGKRANASLIGVWLQTSACFLAKNRVFVGLGEHPKVKH